VLKKQTGQRLLKPHANLINADAGDSDACVLTLISDTANVKGAEEARRAAERLSRTVRSLLQAHEAEHASIVRELHKYPFIGTYSGNCRAARFSLCSVRWRYTRPDLRCG